MLGSVGNRSFRRPVQEETTLNITPFMNLMVVLIPFLLSGVVFSRLAILEMNLPTSQGATQAAPSTKEPFRLIVTLHPKELTVRGSGVDVTRFPLQDGKYDLNGLVTVLQKVKQANPTEKSAIILSEPDIPYASLVAVMDACREKGSQVLFPDISIGEVRPS